MSAKARVEVFRWAPDNITNAAAGLYYFVLNYEDARHVTVREIHPASRTRKR